MPTNIKSFANQSDRSAIAFNAENIGNSLWIRSQDIEDDISLWISFHTDKPLLLGTKRGVCHITDRNWKVFGQWEGESEFIFLEGGGQGVGGEVTVTIDGNGDVSMAKK
jgi:hypothetical protein